MKNPPNPTDAEIKEKLRIKNSSAVKAFRKKHRYQYHRDMTTDLANLIYEFAHPKEKKNVK